MKGIDPIKPKIENHEKEIKQNEITFIGSLIKPFKNATLYEFDTEEMELRVADVDRKVAMGYDGEVQKTNKFTRNKHCLYLWALNDKNALRKVKKALEIT